MFDRPHVRHALVTAVARGTDQDPLDLGDETTIESLDVDSLGLTEILLDVEDALDAEVPPEVLDHLGDPGLTIGDLLRLLVPRPDGAHPEAARS